MFKALRAKEVCQNYKEVITPENDNTISSNPDRQPIYLSEDPVPGPSRTSEIDNDNVSEISDLFNSDDSVADPDFSVSDLFSNKYTAIESDDDFTELANFLETRKSTVRSILPKLDNIKRDESIFIATTEKEYMGKLVNCGLFNIESITLKYLTKGHTHMTADGVHGNIETHIKRQDAVYDFEDYKQVIFKSRKNIEVIEVEKSYQWSKKKRSPRRNDDNDLLKKFLLNQVKVKFINGCINLFLKEDFDEAFVELDFLMKKFNIKVFPEMAANPRGVKTNKKEGIVAKLIPLMPLNRRQFWFSLAVNDRVEDLVTSGQNEHD
ncbi:hypothetical protein ACJJTC_005769 [Scirpophaga incertulas]